MAVVQHGSRIFARSSARLELSSNAGHGLPFARFPARVSPPPGSWTCRQCQTRPHSCPAFRITPAARVRPSATAKRDNGIWRSFSSCSPRPADVAHPEEPKIVTTEPHTRPSADQQTLPSHSQSRRSDISKRMQSFMDDMLARAAVAGQRVNSYTGTDYSGIETLRQQIVEQERQLKARLTFVTAARDAHAAAHAEQAASQKEVVSLLERKTSWSPSDLDRYTSLIRSEHMHEQSVASARQKLAAAEKELEEARSELERKERKQYHEEQIWSDTIRRNSTWVTFGLMGFNILLLIANIGIFEPWRRRRMVREVKHALDQKTITSGPTLADSPAIAAAPAQGPEISAEPALAKEVEKPIISLPEPIEQPVELSTDIEVLEPTKTPLEIEAKPGEVAVVLEPSNTESSASISMPSVQQSAMSRLSASLQQVWRRTSELYHEWSQGPLSYDRLTLSKIEVTTLAVEGVVVGLAIMGCAASLLSRLK